MTIVIDSRLFGTKDENAISIIYGTPLGNPFKIGNQNCSTGSRIETKEQMLQAYEDWMLYRIRTRILPTI